MELFIAARIKRTHTIKLHGAPAAVFPLFTPLGETKWDADWRPLPVYPLSGDAEEDGIFRVANHEDIWIVARYLPQEQGVSYIMVNPASRVARIDVDCVGVSDQSTLATISYTFTALTAEGNDYIERMTEEHFSAWIAGWEQAINHYLLDGVAAQHP